MMRIRSTLCSRSFSLVLLALIGCSDDDTGHGNEAEVITTVTLTFTPAGGGASLTATFDDPDGDGGDAPTMTPIDLIDGTTYTMLVRFENRLETPPEEITDEVRDEGDEHQLFFTGSAVQGPATSNTTAALTHAYDDTDSGGLPIGLSNTIVAAAGTGQMTVTLRHLPPVNDTPVKTADLAARARTGGLDSIPGDTDAQVTFAVTVE